MLLPINLDLHLPVDDDGGSLSIMDQRFLTCSRTRQISLYEDLELLVSALAPQHTKIGSSARDHCEVAGIVEQHILL